MLLEFTRAVAKVGTGLEHVEIHAVRLLTPVENLQGYVNWLNWLKLGGS